MRGKHLTQQGTLTSDCKALIFERESTTLLDERGDIRVVQEELVEPCDLGEHLQIGEVLRLKVFLGPFRRITGAAESFPELVVARIAANHVHRVRLKQVLQGEAAFVCSQISRWL